MERTFEEETRLIQEKVMNYVHDSLDGKITQGEPMIWAMERFINDLKKTNDPNSKYYFDWYELMKFDRWCRSTKHSKGTLAGQPIVPHVSWLFEFANILCFIEKETGYRRFKEIFIFQSRKQGKTQKVALLASYISFLSEEQEEVYIAGWSREQSNLAYEEMLFQIQRMELLKNRYSDSYNHVRVLNNGSTIKALSREAKKFGDGTSPSLAIIDEYANSHETDEIVDVLKSGMVTRPNRLTVYITTAGFDLNYPAYSFYQYCKEVVNPELDTKNESLFVAIYELDEDDDIKDEENWIKSNPVVASYKEGIEFLREELQVALDRPEKMRNFLTKNMNIWVDQPEDGYMEIKRWNEMARSDEEIEGFLADANCFIGIDASMTTDLTSVALVGVKDGKYAVRQHSFVPSERFYERMNQDNVRYDLFEQQGFLTRTPGSVVDYSYLQEKIKEWASRYNVKEVAYDKWNLTHFAQDMESEGFNMIEVPQTINQLSHPTKQFRADVYEEKVFNEDDPLLRWAINNAVLRADAQENIMISKKSSTDRIDPLAATLNAYSRAIGDPYALDLNTYIMSDDFSF